MFVWQSQQHTMKQSFLSSLFNTLTESEISALESVVQSPYLYRGINQDKLLMMLYLLKENPDSPPEKEELSEILFPGMPWVPGKIDKLMSEFSHLIRLFLLIEPVLKETNSFDHQMEWAVTLRKRGLMSRYRTVNQHIADSISATDIESLDFYHQQFLFAYEKYDVESQSNQLKSDINIVDTIGKLDVYYLARRLELHNFLLLQQKMVRIDVPPHLSHMHANFIAPEEVEKNTLLKIALMINEQLSSERPSVAAIHDILTLLKKNESRIDPITLQNFYAYLRNFCTFLAQMGDISFVELLHTIQRDNLSKGYLFVDGKLTPSAYLSIVRTAVRVGEANWALQFIEKYKDYLFNEDSKHDYFHLTKAECLFAMKRFDEALDILPSSFVDVLYHVNCKRLELKLYYELKSDLLTYKLDSYKMFISRASKKVLSDTRREYESNFVNLLLQICQCPPFDTVKKEKIADRIREKKTVADRDWLLEKTSEFR